MAAGPWRLALPDAYRSIDDPTCSRTSGSKALFLTSNKAVEHGLIRDDKDFFREGLREAEEY